MHGRRQGADRLRGSRGNRIRTHHRQQGRTRARGRAAHPERQRLWRQVQAMARPFQRRRHQISAKLSGLEALAGKGGGRYNPANRPGGGPRLKPTLQLRQS